jgi:glycosyltransferase involved in cell wall biosynthesis
MRRILYIDPHFSTQSPSMKSVVRALPRIAEDFDEVEVWSVTCEVEHPKLRWDPLFWAPRPWPLRLVWCVLAFHLRACWRFVVLRQPRPDLIQCTDFYAMFADVIYVHFHFGRYQEIIESKPGLIRLSASRRLMTWFCRRFENACFRWAHPKVWLTVSDSMAGHLRGREGLSPVEVLPNAYDPSKFSLAVRAQHREAMRRELGFAEEDIVLGFSALGDFERKGLPLLLAAAHKLISENLAIHILIVGASSADGGSFAELAPAGFALDRIQCTGRVPDTERYFAAMDAFVFPSHCESFCLVLMEAAAMGLRVYPAAFDGHEMTLVEGGNGSLVAWDDSLIADRLRADIAMGLLKNPHQETGRAMADGPFREALANLYQRIRK